MSVLESEFVAPGVRDMVAGGQLTEAQAVASINAGVILAGYIFWAGHQPKYRDMFTMNDRDHFIEGLTNSPVFMQEVGLYLMSCTKRE